MKIPTPQKLKSGTWYIHMRLGGKSVYVTAKTAKECKDKATLIKAEHRAGKRRISQSDLSIGEIVDCYIAKYESVLSPETIRKYKSIRKNRFAGWMIKRPEQITQKMIDDELLRVSPKTVINGWGLVTAALNDLKIPISDIKLPQNPQNELPFLEPDEINDFIAAAKDDPCETEMLLELHGLRASEVRKVIKDGLINTEKGVIKVHGAIVRGENGFVAKETNKTNAGTRIVPILIPRLSEIACSETQLHSPTMILKHVHKTCERAGVTDVTNHGLRRTFASLAYSCGIPERNLMEMGGWDDAETMHKIYIKLAQRDKDKYAAKLKEFFAPQNRLEKATQILVKLKAEYNDIKALNGVFSEIDKLKLTPKLTHDF